MAGLQNADIPIENHASETLTEALDDIIEIAQVNYDEISATEEDEAAYFELVEHVRLVRVNGLSKNSIILTSAE